MINFASFGAGAITSLIMNVAALGGNPVLGVLNDFVELIGIHVNSAFADAAGRLAEYLFSEKAQERMERGADAAENFADKLEQCIIVMEKVDKVATQLTKDYDDLYRKSKQFADTMDTVKTALELATGKADTWARKLWDLYEIIKKIIDEIEKVI